MLRLTMLRVIVFLCVLVAAMAVSAAATATDSTEVKEVILHDGEAVAEFVYASGATVAVRLVAPVEGNPVFEERFFISLRDAAAVLDLELFWNRKTAGGVWALRSRDGYREVVLPAGAPPVAESRKYLSTSFYVKNGRAYVDSAVLKAFGARVISEYLPDEEGRVYRVILPAQPEAVFAPVCRDEVDYSDYFPAVQRQNGNSCFWSAVWCALNAQLAFRGEKDVPYAAFEQAYRVSVAGDSGTAWKEAEWYFAEHSFRNSDGKTVRVRVHEEDGEYPALFCSLLRERPGLCISLPCGRDRCTAWEVLYRVPDGAPYVFLKTRGGEAKDMYHTVAVVGFSARERAWLIQNSWGPGWGRNGRAWISWNTAVVARFYFVNGEVKS